MTTTTKPSTRRVTEYISVYVERDHLWKGGLCVTAGDRVRVSGDIFYTVFLLAVFKRPQGIFQKPRV